MERIPRGKYTKEFREEAVKLVTEGESVITGGRTPVILPPSTLGNWVKGIQSRQAGRDRQEISATDRS